MWDRKRNTTIRKMANQQRISAVLVGRRLRFLGHMLRLHNCRLPKKLIVCAPVHGRRRPGGQKLRWCNVLQSDLKKCQLETNWLDCAQNRSEWRCLVKQGVRDLNHQAELEEKHKKDFNKKRRVEQQTQAAVPEQIWPTLVKNSHLTEQRHVRIAHTLLKCKAYPTTNAIAKADLVDSLMQPVPLY